MFCTVSNGIYNRFIPVFPVVPSVDSLASNLFALSEQPHRTDPQQISCLVRDLKRSMTAHQPVALPSLAKIILALDHLQMEDTELNQRILSFLIYNAPIVFSAQPEDFSVFIRFIHKNDRSFFKEIMKQNGFLDIEQLSLDALNRSLPLGFVVNTLKQYLTSNLPIDGKSLMRLMSFFKGRSNPDLELGLLLSEAAVKYMYSFPKEDVVICTRILARLFPDPSIGWMVAKKVILAAGCPDIEDLTLNFANPYVFHMEIPQDLLTYLQKNWPVCGRSLATLTHCLKDLELKKTYPFLEDLIVGSAIKNIDLCNNSEIVVVTHAVSQFAGRGKASFFQRVADISLPKINSFTPRELVVLAHALSQGEFLNKKALFNKMAETLLGKIGGVTPKSFPILAEVFTTAGILHEEFLKEISIKAREHMTVYSKIDLMGLISSFARAGFEAPELFHQIEQWVVERIDDLSLEELHQFGRLLSRPQYSKLHQAIEARLFKESLLMNAEPIRQMDALSRKIYSLYSKNTVIRDYAMGTRGPSIDYYVPAKKLILQRSDHIEISDPLEHHAHLDRDIVLSDSLQRVCDFARKIGARLILLSAIAR